MSPTPPRLHARSIRQVDAAKSSTTGSGQPAHWYKTCFGVRGVRDFATPRAGRVNMTPAEAAEPTEDPLGASAARAGYRIVAACDFSPLGDRVVVEALRLCASQPAASLHVI